MTREGLIWCLLWAAAALGFMAWERWRCHKTMVTIDRMLSSAMKGRFREAAFDESRLSALETRFAHYLSAAEVSAQNVAQEEERIKTLISDISHQTKTPIANLLLHSELLGEEALPPTAQSSVEAIHRQAEKLRFLIDALVKLSRLENGIITLSPRQEPLEPLLRQVAEQFLPKAQAKGLSLNWTVEEGELSAYFDRKWTVEALGNLVDNAIKYTEKGGVTLSACSYEFFVRIDVRDSGCGIPEKEQAQVFSRFYRAEQAREEEGVGIGLYLARQIVSSQGGYIKLRSAPGKGSTFSLFLPRQGQIFQNR